MGMNTDAVVPDSIPDPVKSLKALEGMSLDDFVSRAVNGLVEFAIHLAVAVLVFYVGRFIIRKLYSVCHSIFLRRRIDPSLSTFVLSLIRIVLYFILVITVIGILGIETSSFLALFASAGVAVGLALSGTLQNFAGGVLILLLKPYRIGDYIEAQGYAGRVKEIQIFSTIINTPDNKQIIIPNGGLSTSSVNNYSKEAYRRVEWTVSLSYDTDFTAARNAILDIVDSDPRVMHLTSDEEKVQSDIEAEQQKMAEESARDADTRTAVEAAVDTTAVSRRGKPWYRRMFDSSSRKAQLLQQRMERQRREVMSLIPKPYKNPMVALGSLGASSIDITVRAWTRSDDYWDLFYDLNERFFTRLPQLGFSFPFPQLDLHFPVGALRHDDVSETPSSADQKAD